MIITDLQRIKERVRSYISPATPEMLACYLSGLKRGYMLGRDISFDDYLRANEEATKSRGWEFRAISVSMEMREKGISEEEIIREQLNVEIDTWRILENEKP